MNVSLRRCLYIFSVFLVPLLGKAQSVVSIDLETYLNVPATHVFVSTPNVPTLVTAPQHGTYAWVQSPPFNYTITYTPDADFIGDDFMRLWIWNTPSNWSYLDLHITVLPAQVDAVRDYAVTNVNTPVQIPVLANDFSSNGTLILSAIPVVNSGAATYTPGASTLTFTPAAGFHGLTHLNYVVCDGAGTCDNGTVSITVMEPTPGSTSDTLRIFTKKNQEQVVLIPSVYTLTQGPSHGAYNAAGDIPVYTPAANYVGLDYLLFTHNGAETVVEVNVLNLQNNTFAFDDYAYITSYEEAEFNVLENDNFQSTSCFTVNQPQYGSVVHNGNGNVVYTPPTGFQGVDKFTYVSCPPMNPGNAEMATVYVFVGNYQPSSAVFNMSTPKRTPLIIGYDVPILDFNFNIVNQGDLGQVIVLPGQVDTTIYDQPIVGYNLVIYIPNEDVDEGADEFEITYCTNNPEGDCMYQQSVKVELEILNIGAGDGPMCFGDCVWAGDTNFDGVVNMQDLLPLGLFMGEIGTPRQNATMAYWYGQYADNWNNIFIQSPVDLKHLDADGDSIVTALDTAAISMFYGKTHSLTPVQLPFYDYEIQLVGDLFVNAGDLVVLDMMLGSSTTPAKDIYGFTFPFSYNSMFFVPESVEADYGTGGWLSYNSPVLYMQRNNQQGLLETGFTRTSGLSASGHGKIGELRFVVTDDLDGFRTDDDVISVPVGGGMSTAMTSGGQYFGITIGEQVLHIRLNKDEQPKLSSDQLKVYPNPTEGLLNVHLNGNREFSRVVVYNLVGQQVFALDTQSNRTQLDVSNLAEGLYVVSAYTTDGVVSQKFKVKH
ncbi:MAG: T9SS type A sorting domain-containing protein [Saprospiraceae bacterium]|nr:T9SS type A sorting domain-containing protein [Saprospiraceae bacterium]